MLKPVARSTTTVTLYEGDDYHEFERRNDAYMEAAAANKSGADRMGDDPDTGEAARALDAFKAEATGRGQVVTIKSPPRRIYRELVAKHPAREDNAVDARRGFNVETFADDFVPASLPIAGQFEDEAARRAWVDELSPGNFDKLYAAALQVAEESAVIDPKVNISSRLGLISPTSSESPERLG